MTPNRSPLPRHLARPRRATIGLTALLVGKGDDVWLPLPIAILGVLAGAVLRTTDASAAAG